MSNWQPIETAPKDGTLLILLVDYDGDEGADHPLENSLTARTVGFNNFDDDGEDVWHFAGWCWSHDHFVEGRGAPIKWQPMPDKPVENQPGLPEPRSCGTLAHTEQSADQPR